MCSKTEDGLSATRSVAAETSDGILRACCIQLCVVRFSASVTGVSRRPAESDWDRLTSVDQKYYSHLISFLQFYLTLWSLFKVVVVMQRETTVDVRICSAFDEMTSIKWYSLLKKHLMMLCVLPRWELEWVYCGIGAVMAGSCSWCYDWLIKIPAGVVKQVTTSLLA